MIPVLYTVLLRAFTPCLTGVAHSWFTESIHSAFDPPGLAARLVWCTPLSGRSTFRTVWTFDWTVSVWTFSVSVEIGLDRFPDNPWKKIRPLHSIPAQTGQTSGPDGGDFDHLDLLRPF